MGARYSVSKIGTALATTADSMTITAPATRALKISEIRIFGQGAATAANEILVSRSTAGTTPVAITPIPIATASAAAAFTAAGSWTTTPTIGVTIRRIGVNSNGAYSPLVFMPGNEIEVPPSGQISIRSASGTGIVTIDILVEEIG